jgi:DNA-binding transcriptional ArsR family regulator
LGIVNDQGDSEQPASRSISEIDTLKALASPIRRRILRYLDDHGQATSTTVAEALGESTGTTSYHLRLLASHGLISEAGPTGRRERWWRKVPLDLRFPAPSADATEEELAVHAELHRQRITEDLAGIAALLELRDPAEQRRIRIARSGVRLTRQQLDAFFADYMNLIRRYAAAADSTDDDGGLLQLRLYVFPEPNADEQ